jgi:hypothetical protein
VRFEDIPLAREAEMKKGFKISLKWLEEHDACSPIRRKFKRVYGNRSVKLSTALRKMNEFLKKNDSLREFAPEDFLYENNIITEGQAWKAWGLWHEGAMENNADEIARNNYLIKILVRKGL